MEIDLLWDFRGWLPLLSTESVAWMDSNERFRRSSLMLIWLLLLLFLLLSAQPKYHLKDSRPSISTGRLLSSSKSESMEVDSKAPPSSPAPFDASEHEVPNGPNPISNK